MAGHGGRGSWVMEVVRRVAGKSMVSAGGLKKMKWRGCRFWCERRWKKEEEEEEEGGGVGRAESTVKKKKKKMKRKKRWAGFG